MTEPFGGFYRGRRVLITGHSGFKGSWLSLWLLRLGASVCGYALRPPTEPSLFDVLGLSTEFGSAEQDIRDVGRLETAMDSFQPEIVFHLAAQPIVRAAYKLPRETYEINVMGTVNLLETVRRTPSVRTVVVITTDKCYEIKDWPYGYRENDVLGGRDPYSSSKACAELVCAAYRQSFFMLAVPGARGVGLASARAGNVIGGGDWAEDRLIPDCVRSLTSERPVVLRNPHAVRPWQHVLEPLSGYLWLAACLDREPGIFAGGWNFGPDTSAVLCVKDLVAQFVTAWGEGGFEVASPAAAPHEASLLQLDIAKSARVLSWRPVSSLEHGIKQTAAWYLRFHRGGRRDMRGFSEQQISEFETAARAAGVAWCAA
jgi:CDP-glucose 4,6-dehydratase